MMTPATYGSYVGIVGLWAASSASVLVTHLAASGKLGRNQVVGIRTPSTMASDAGWRAGHRAALPFVWLTVLVSLAGTFAIPSSASPSLLLLFAMAMIAIVIIAAVVAGRRARRG